MAVRPNTSARSKRLKDTAKDVACVEAAVRGSIENLREKKGDSFVIYGEPQSGKTEMMICLTGKLVDEGYPCIVHLRNDSVVSIRPKSWKI